MLTLRATSAGYSLLERPTPLREDHRGGDPTPEPAAGAECLAFHLRAGAKCSLPDVRARGPDRLKPLASLRQVAGYPPVNQWTGGQRYVLGILLGQLGTGHVVAISCRQIHASGARVQTVTSGSGRPPSTTGDLDSPRSLQALQAACRRYSVGFAEFAANGKVNAGRSNRDCPAKDLALLLGQIFFEECQGVMQRALRQEFDVKAWEAVDPNIRLDPQGGTKAFQIRPIQVLPKT